MLQLWRAKIKGADAVVVELQSWQRLGHFLFAAEGLKDPSLALCGHLKNTPRGAAWEIKVLEIIPKRDSIDLFSFSENSIYKYLVNEKFLGSIILGI